METFSALLAICEGNSTGHRWIPRTKANDAELWYFLWSAPDKNGWVNNGEAGDLGRHWAHYDIIVMNSPEWKKATRAILKLLHYLKRVWTSRVLYLHTVSLTHCPLRDFNKVLVKWFSNSFQRLMVGTSLMKFLAGECIWTSLMISQHWFR